MPAPVGLWNAREFPKKRKSFWGRRKRLSSACLYQLV